MGANRRFQWLISCYFATLLFLVCLLPDHVHSSQSTVQFTLSNINSRKFNEGFVEVKYLGRTYGVCSYGWDVRNSQVLCRQLGYTDFSLYKSRVSNKLRENLNYWTTLYDCQGREQSLSQCKTNRLHRYTLEEHCSEGHVAWVSCSNVSRQTKPLIPPLGEKVKDFAVRLENREVPKGKIIHQGVLETKVNGKWTKVCGDHWTTQESYVACGELGFPAVNSTMKRNGSNQVYEYFPMRFSCTGQEATLLSCLTRGNTNSPPCQTGPVALVCLKARDEFGDLLKRKESETGLVRLRAGHREFEGRVEVFKYRRWSTVCGNGWDINDANVVCRQLGFGTAREAPPSSEFGEGEGRIFLTSVNCSGNERTILDCPSSRYTEKCKHYNDAGVRCNYPKVNFRKIRLVGGKTPYEGRVEVYHRKGWHGVCGIDFDQLDGRVVCRELGLGFVKEASSGYKFGVRHEKLMFNIKCQGNEKSLRHCPHIRKPAGRCSYYAMAYAICTKEHPDIIVDLDALQSTITLTRIRMFALTCARDEKCLSSSAYQHLTFYSKKYRRNLLRFSARIINKGTAAFLPAKRKSKWIWHSCHKHFHSMERFSDFDIIDFYGRKVAEGHKASFCLEDTSCEPGYKKVFNCTNKGQQGISVNCADNYKYTIDCQWVDLTDLNDGNYSLLVHINPKNLIGESDYSNNYAACEIDYHHGKIRVGHCSSAPCHTRSYGGTGYGLCCHFPFTYNGTTYHECTTEGFGHAWCSTTPRYDVDKKWGYCELQKALSLSKQEDRNSLYRT